LKKGEVKVFNFVSLIGTYHVEVSCLKKGVANLKDSVEAAPVSEGSTYTHTFEVKKC
jgi:hypothetical protein